MNIYVPYTYLIGWSNLNKWYYGVKFNKRRCNPSDLWVSYFTSSKYVKQFREKNGDPDVIQIRKTFNNSEEARKWETKVLKRMKVVGDNKWLNKTDNISIESMPGEKNPFYGKNHTKESKKISGEKISKALKGRPKSIEHNIKISLSKKGVPRSESTKQKDKQARLNLEKNPIFGITCLSCKKTFAHPGNYKQHKCINWL